MLWSEVREAYPSQWLIIEALEAETTPDMIRQLKRIAVVERCADGWAAFQSYRRLHKERPEREYYFIHTDRIEPEIHVQHYVGVRGQRAANAR